jgi:hypothetical protein
MGKPKSDGFNNLDIIISTSQEVFIEFHHSH